nr:alpha/beta fold hydrolase [Rhodovulum sulfidophilum]
MRKSCVASKTSAVVTPVLESLKSHAVFKRYKDRGNRKKKSKEAGFAFTESRLNFGKRESLIFQIHNQKVDIIFFHGGGAFAGEPLSLVWAGKPLAEKGIRLILPSYRVLSRDRSSVFDAISDAESFVHKFLKKLPHDRRLIVGGASFGGLLALHILRAMPEKTFNGILLVNPVCDTTRGGFSNKQIPTSGLDDISPNLYCDSLPQVPCLILHPADDQVVALRQTTDFLSRWRNGKAAMEVWPRSGGHGAFNLVGNQGKFVEKCSAFSEKCDA